MHLIDSKYQNQISRSVGIVGERKVAEYLERFGFTIIATNYRIRGGEIDIIARKKNLLACIEVKTRQSSLIDPASLVPQSKQRKIITTALQFISTHTEYAELVCRFDVALVEKCEGVYDVHYIENAFSAEYE